MIDVKNSKKYCIFANCGIRKAYRVGIIKKFRTMKKFFCVVVVAAVLFAANSCKPEEEEPVVIKTEDSSGFCTVIFHNLEAEHYYDVFIDGKSVKSYMLGTHTVSDVQAGTRTLRAVQASGMIPPASAITRETVVKILTDSVYTWQFP